MSTSLDKQNHNQKSACFNWDVYNKRGMGFIYEGITFIYQKFFRL